MTKASSADAVQVRSIAVERLVGRRGQLDEATMRLITDALFLVLDPQGEVKTSAIAQQKRPVRGA